MKKKKDNSAKKGISPLIATILLVMFSVALIALLISWGKHYIEEKAEKEGALAEKQAACQNVEIGFVDVCTLDVTSYNITLKNKRDQKIDGFLYRVKEDGKAESGELRKSLKGLEQKTFEVTFTEEINPETVDIIPSLKAGKNKYVPCSGQHLEIKVDVTEKPCE